MRSSESFLFSKNLEAIAKIFKTLTKTFFGYLKMKSKKVYVNVRSDIMSRRSFGIYLGLYVKTSKVILQLYVGSVHTTCYISKMFNILLL